MIRITALAVTGAALLLAAGSGAATAPSLTVQVAPGTISSGQPALASAAFTNARPFALANVVVTLRFPTSVSVNAPGCIPASGPTSTVACSIGTVGAGATARTNITFVAGSAGSFQVAGRATWGKGHDFAEANSEPAQIFAADDPTHRGTCAVAQGTLDAELNGQGTEMPTLPVADPSLGLPCTPLAVGVEARPSDSSFGTDIAIVDVPKLKEPAVVDLTFRDGELPGSQANPNPLREIPNPADLNPATFIVVPSCGAGGVIPPGFDSCIAGVHPEDPDLDRDAGVITLRVQGSGLGDPRYVG